MTQPTTPWTSEMHEAYRRFKVLFEAETAYGNRPLPPIDKQYPPPHENNTMRLAFFAAFASDEQFAAHHDAICEDMRQWQARIQAQQPMKIDTSKLEFKI